MLKWQIKALKSQIRRELTEFVCRINMLISNSNDYLQLCSHCPLKEKEKQKGVFFNHTEHRREMGNLNVKKVK